MRKHRRLADADRLEVVADPQLVARFLRHVPVQEVAQLPMFVGKPARGGGADRIEVPDNLVELEQQIAIALDRESVGDRAERHGCVSKSRRAWSVRSTSDMKKSPIYPCCPMLRRLNTSAGRIAFRPFAASCSSGER
jgi:hypothetical protein